MALYAFDGTWQQDQPDLEHDTNVVWFRDAYQDGAVFYEPGVGTRFSWLGKLAGGLTGAGGRRRVREALAHLDPNDPNIDIIGFSRGSALALHFANSLPAGAKVRFLGLFDTVPCFGVPGNAINFGWKLGLPGSVGHCYHAMALDEARMNFPLHRLKGDDCLTEMWFRGAHSDVGGGNANSGLSSVALDWMFQCARCCGVQLRGAFIGHNRTRMRPEAAPTSPMLNAALRRRQVLPGDEVNEWARRFSGAKS
ncbi:MAG: DUF2235 domain-containing protein [Acidobacteriota bacterium]